MEHVKLSSFKVGDLVNVAPSSELGMVVGFKKEDSTWNYSITHVLVKMVKTQNVWRVLAEDLEHTDLSLDTLNYSC
jgi:hypothetical protein